MARGGGVGDGARAFGGDFEGERALRFGLLDFLCLGEGDLALRGGVTDRPFLGGLFEVELLLPGGVLNLRCLRGLGEALFFDLLSRSTCLTGESLVLLSSVCVTDFPCFSPASAL